MAVTIIDRVALALVLAGAAMQPAFAGGHGGGGGHGGMVFHPGGGFHGGWGGGMRVGGPRGLPPIAGVIHERAGMRPYFSAYGHTATGMRFGGGGGYGRGGFSSYGHTQTALPMGGAYRPYAGGYGHVGTSLRFGEGRRFAAGRFIGGYGGFGGGFGAGTYGGPGVYGDGGIYGGQGSYGTAGTYGGVGTFGGGYGTTATQSLYGNGGGVSYRSERPLAARFAEPPLGPSPGAPYSPDDAYAYAASADVGSGPRVVGLHGFAGAGCDCGPRTGPFVYRYGVGTAY